MRPHRHFWVFAAVVVVWVWLSTRAAQVVPPGDVFIAPEPLPGADPPANLPWSSFIPDTPGPLHGLKSDRYGYQQLWDMAKGLFGQDTSPAPVGLNYPVVLDAILKGMERMRQVFAAVQYLQKEYFEHTVRSLGEGIIQQGELTITVVQELAALNAATNARIDTIETTIIPNIVAAIAAQNERLDADILHAVAQLQTWTTNDVLIPLNTRIVGEAQARYAADHRIVSVDIPAAVAGVGAQLAPIAATATAAYAIARAVYTWVGDCGAPMCDTVGPKTDLGKLLKALNIGADLALFAELVNMNKDDLTQLFEAVATWAGRAIDAFDTTFVEGGGRIRDVLAAVGQV